MAYPPGFKKIVVGEGNTYGGALADVKYAIKFHVETLEMKTAKIFDFCGVKIRACKK